MIRFSFTRALAVLAALSVLVPPVAAQGQGRRSEPRALVAMRNFSQCVFNRSPRAVVRVLAMDPQTDAARTALRRLAQGHDDCAPGSRLVFNGIFFAGGLAERRDDEPRRRRAGSLIGRVPATLRRASAMR